MTDRFAALRNLPRLQLPVVTPPAPPPKKCKPNDLCSCGSHIKYKKCCMHKTLNAARDNNPLAKMQELMRSNKELAATMRKLTNKA